MSPCLSQCESLSFEPHKSHGNCGRSACPSRAASTHPRRTEPLTRAPPWLLQSGLVLAGPAVAAQDQEQAAANKPTTLDKVQVQEAIEDVRSPRRSSPSRCRTRRRPSRSSTSELFNQQGATTLTEALRNSPAVGTFYAGENGSTSTGRRACTCAASTPPAAFSSTASAIWARYRATCSTSRRWKSKRGRPVPTTGAPRPRGAINTVSKQAFLQDAACRRP